MKIDTYGKYIDSGSNWFTKIPSTWTVNKLKYTCKLIKDGTHASIKRVDNGYPLLSVRNIINSKFVFREDDSHISKEDYLSIVKSFKIKVDDIQLAIVGATLGKVALVEPMTNFATQRSLATIRVDKNFLVPLFLFFYKQSNLFQNYLWASTSYSAQPGIYLGTIQLSEIAVPPLHEQTQIANYLNSKTAAIDKKIALLEKKASSYKELRKSLINETVCRGLDKSAQLKDSGIGWIGQIPEHWGIVRIKDIFEISRGRVIGQTELIENGKYPVYSSQTSNGGCLGFINTFDFNSPLITWTTDGANAGTVFKRSGKFNCTNICGTLKPIKNKSDIDYMAYAVQESTKHNKRIDTNGAKIMSNEMQVISIVFPPLSEQIEIAKYIDAQTSKIDQITSNIKSQIETLKELRKTLINDVVTGKIRVSEVHENEVTN
jgi:type I restriction enzyme S subunit